MSRMRNRRPSRPSAAALGAAVAVAGLLSSVVSGTGATVGPSGAASVRAAHGSSGPSGLHPLARHLSNATFTRPPTTAQCEASAHVACYAPEQYQRAYSMVPLYAAGLTGRGRTIAVVDSFGSPTIAHDLAAFDRAFGLPAPPKLSVIQPAGKVPPYDPTNAAMVGWAGETTLDVEWAHAMAPGARIVVVATPVAETEGPVGIPQIVQAENAVVDNHLADVISESFGATEETFPSAQSLLRLRSSFVNAAAKGVTVLASSGDEGATSARLNGHLFTTRVNSWPSSDPLVTSVGGTQLHLDARGDRTAPDNVWNDTQVLNGPAAGGGGLSHIFARPAYQDSVKDVVGNRRGTPDISLSAAVDGGALVYTSFAGDRAGWHIYGGTSESSPLLAGVVAIAAQAAGHPLGRLNPRLYALAGRGAPGIVDVTRGDNTVTFQQAGRTVTVPGFRAKPGYDLASGLGTVNGARLVAELAAR